MLQTKPGNFSGFTKKKQSETRKNAWSTTEGVMKTQSKA